MDYFESHSSPDVVLIGAGIMSATLGFMLISAPKQPPLNSDSYLYIDWRSSISWSSLSSSVILTDSRFSSR